LDQPDFSLHPNPWVRRLHTSWPLFRAFRVDVRVSWTILIWPFVHAAAYWSFLTPKEAVGWGVAMTLAQFASVWTHEMGHIAMGRRCGVETYKMTLRGLGGLAHLDSPAQSPRDEAKIALAGPVTHFAWMAVLFPLVWHFEAGHSREHWHWMLEGFAVYQITMMVFNLLPVWPLDGGRATRAALATRMNSGRASYLASNVGFVGNGLFILTGLGVSFEIFGETVGRTGFLLVWVGIDGIRACRQLRMEALYGDAYGDPDPFQKTLLESQAAVREMEDEERQVRHAAADERRLLQEKADRLLDRINELGGVDKLSAKERRELEEASRALARGD
jgi:Zn-dependent protease